jgi:hypothetical protein
LETRYNRYIVVNQQLNPLQISYRPVTPVTSLSISNLAATFPKPIPSVRLSNVMAALPPAVEVGILPPGSGLELSTMVAVRAFFPPGETLRLHGRQEACRYEDFPVLDAGRGSGRVCRMNTGSLYFRNGFAGWFYFSPSSWRMRLR